MTVAVPAWIVVLVICGVVMWAYFVLADKAWDRWIQPWIRRRAVDKAVRGGLDRSAAEAAWDRGYESFRDRDR